MPINNYILIVHKLDVGKAKYCLQAYEGSQNFYKLLCRRYSHMIGIPIEHQNHIEKMN